MDKALTVTVPVVLKGEARRASSCRAASSTSCTREIEVECLPADIPEHIDVDVSELMLHQGVRVRDLRGRGAQVEAGQRAETMLVHIVVPKVEEAAARGRGGGGGRRRRPSPRSSRRARPRRKTTRRSGAERRSGSSRAV